MVKQYAHAQWTVLFKKHCLCAGVRMAPVRPSITQSLKLQAQNNLQVRKRNLSQPQ